MRISLAFVFVWFGVSEVADPVYFSSYIPSDINNLGLDGNLLVQIHGAFLVFLSICLIFKLFVRLIGLVAALVLVQIIAGLLLISNFEINEIIIRDIGLLGLALAIWLNEIRQN